MSFSKIISLMVFKRDVVSKVLPSIKKVAIRLSAVGLLLCSLSPQAQVMVGAYVSDDAWSVEGIKKFNKEVKKRAAFITVFSSFSNNWEQHLSKQSDNIASQRAVPLISWMPIDESRPDDNLLPEITDGKWDNYLNTWGLGLKQWLSSQSQNASVYLRFGHEFNGDWYSYSNTPADFVAAWQYVHQKFSEFGLDQSIQWVWSPNHLSFDDYNDITVYYPGDNYVDWTGIDGYNWGDYFPFSSWRSFEYIFGPTYRKLIDFFPSKPIMINEFSSVSPFDRFHKNSGRPYNYTLSRRLWFRLSLYVLKRQFPAIRAVSFFNKDKERARWSLYDIALHGADASGLVGVNEAIQDPYFISNPLIIEK